MLIKSISFYNKQKSILFISIIIFIVIICFFTIFFKSKNKSNNYIVNKEIYEKQDYNSSLNEYEEETVDNYKTSYIKWVDFKGSYTALSKLSNLDISSHINDDKIKFNWIELMAYLGCKYGGDFSRFKQKDLDNLIEKLKSGMAISDLSKDYKLYDYYYQSYDAIFHEYIGYYTIQKTDESGNKNYITSYGLKVFSPIAKNYSFSHYKDFGTARSYGYKRVHLGNDLLRKYWYPYYCSRIRIY